MKKFPWRYVIVVLVIILLSLALFFWRKKKLNQPIALPESSETVETLSYAVNDFPLENLGEAGFESYRLNCRFEQINLYPNYYDAPILPGNWRLLAEYPRNFVSANECMIEWQWNSAVGTVPYSEEEMLEFRQTGDPAAFDYYQLNGEIVFWPIVNFDASINRADRYPDDMDFEQFVN